MEDNVFSIEYIIENGLDKSAYGFVYITTYEGNGMKYIGQSVFRKKNWKTYFGSGTYYKRAEKLHGKEFFSRKIILIAYSKEELDTLEVKLIKDSNAVGSADYYNFSPGGGTNAGLQFSEEWKKKLSDSQKGRIHPEETKRKIGDSNKGKIISEEHKQKLREWHTGKILSDEVKQKLSNANRGDKHHFYKKQHSKESKLKMSEAHKGRVFSEEHKRKLSNAKIKITDLQAEYIRKIYSTGNCNKTKLAKEFLVDRRTICRIINFQGGYQNPLQTAI